MGSAAQQRQGGFFDLMERRQVQRTVVEVKRGHDVMDSSGRGKTSEFKKPQIQGEMPQKNKATCDSCLFSLPYRVCCRRSRVSVGNRTDKSITGRCPKESFYTEMFHVPLDSLCVPGEMRVDVSIATKLKRTQFLFHFG